MKSPCTNICTLFPGTNYCAGCYRNIDEITEWSRMSEQEQGEVYERIYERSYEEIHIRAAELGFVLGTREYDDFIENETYKIYSKCFD